MAMQDASHLRPRTRIIQLLIALFTTLIYLSQIPSFLLEKLNNLNSLTTAGTTSNENASILETSAVHSTPQDPDDDASCPFRDSPLYRSVYIYPTPDFSINQTGPELHRQNSIYSPMGGASNEVSGFFAFVTLCQCYPIAHLHCVTH